MRVMVCHSVNYLSWCCRGWIVVGCRGSHGEEVRLAVHDGCVRVDGARGRVVKNVANHVSGSV